jgi:DNA-binding CsgD family transcriptional regulator
MQLRRVDFEAILGFLADVGGLEFDELVPVEILARLQDLVPCDALMFQEIDVHAKRFGATTCFPSHDEADHDPDDDALYWTVGPCPICHYRDRTGDLAVVRMSDVISRRQYHELPIYREYHRPCGIEHMVDVGLSAGPNRHRSFLLLRGSDVRDFSERDRAVLEMLRPHLERLRARAAARARWREEEVTLDDDNRSRAWASLTPREREILGLVAEGRTNAQIATRLWVAPSTVKKHLEHIYEKLEVGGRTAAALRMHPISVAELTGRQAI